MSRQGAGGLTFPWWKLIIRGEALWSWLLWWCRVRAWSGCRRSWSPGPAPCCCWTADPMSCTSPRTSSRPSTWPSRASCSGGWRRATSPSAPSSPTTRTRRNSWSAARRTWWSCTTRRLRSARSPGWGAPCWGCSCRSCGTTGARLSIWRVRGADSWMCVTVLIHTKKKKKSHTDSSWRCYNFKTSI